MTVPDAVNGTLTESVKYLNAGIDQRRNFKDQVTNTIKKRLKCRVQILP